MNKNIARIHLVPQNSSHSAFEYLNYQDFLILHTNKQQKRLNSLNIDYLFIILGLIKFAEGRKPSAAQSADASRC